MQNISQLGQPSFRNMENAKDAFSGYLSNHEVFKHVKELKESMSDQSEQAQSMKSNTHLSTIIYETIQYLQQTPCVTQSDEIIGEFVRKTAPFKLTKPESLMLLNMRPEKPIDIQAMVEESEERLTEEQIDELIEIIRDTIPAPDPQILMQQDIVSNSANCPSPVPQE